MSEFPNSRQIVKTPKNFSYIINQKIILCGHVRTDKMCNFPPTTHSSGQNTPHTPSDTTHSSTRSSGQNPLFSPLFRRKPTLQPTLQDKTHSSTHSSGFHAGTQSDPRQPLGSAHAPWQFPLSSPLFRLKPTLQPTPDQLHFRQPTLQAHPHHRNP